MANFHRAPEAADGAVAVRRLEEALQRGKAQAATVVDRVLNCQPHDAIVKAAAMTFRPDGKRLLMEAGEARWSFHAHAFGQAASIVAPKGAEYLSMLRDGTDWQLSLLATNFNESFSHSTKRHLVRSEGGDGTVREARGFLSDKYRRIDSRPVCEAFVEGCQAFGAEPYWHAVPRPGVVAAEPGTVPPGRDFRLLFSLERLEAPGVRVRIMRHLFWVGPLLGFVLGCGPAPGSLCDLSTPLPRTGDQQADQNRELVRAIACMNAQSQTNAAWIGVAGAAMGAYATTQASLAESRAVQDAVFSQGLQR